ncbi:MAG: carboxypeptidase M32 [Candidatus Pristimantibacillus lignocellulolyticus]|uniref:Metal-dependent carboxypeptidase n=1 Tax=Candidatus Pristimantibacillus lignocellulolyticus TaxID=2994561 RepID=A0A9J6ZD66_9BACL|nr:MAG: carboxypeptidase M32 [Candidatus Pristimantibacillus lignocellulolyticus]
MKPLEQFRHINTEIKQYEEALAVLYWDLRTGAPRKGMDTRSQVIGTLSAEMFARSTSQLLGTLLTELESEEVWNELSPLDQILVKESRKDYDRSVKIPPALYQKYVILTAQAESKWEVCKEENDYDSFQPLLDEIITITNEMIDLWGVKATRYDTLLDQYEPGMTVAELDQIFGDLRDQLVPLAEKIAASPYQPRTDFLEQSFAVEQQKAYSRFILEQMGFDFEAGRLDESVHPFATGLNPGDVRITTRYLPNDVTSALFGTIHEGGHAMYEQNIADELIGTTLCTGTSMGIHESQSRFWENVIGRSRPFWNAYYAELQSKFPQLASIDMDTFYRGNNVVKPQLIRIEADELTYNLHIIIRYEIEKMIFNEGLQAKDLPKVWNEKYEQYLGVTPPNNAEGVLQDVHWSGGAFGYFPSYSLGNMYAAQFMNTLEQDMPDVWAKVEAGDLHPIRDWLAERIYQYGKMKSPSELVQDITNEALNPQYLVEYLKNKYKDIYRLEEV